MPPLVSFIMPSYNRSSVLKSVLTKICGQQYPFRYEIIVVDNNSSDDSVQMVRDNFPQVRLFANDRNMGAVARNLALEKALGRYIVMLDDDSYPIARSVESAVRIYEGDKQKQIGCIAFNIRRPDGSHETAGIYPNFTGCGAVFRKDIFDVIGYYPEDYLFYVEEYDVSCRIWDAGYKVLNFKELEAVHLKSGLNRDFNGIICRLVKNNMLLWSKYLPPRYAKRQIATELWRYHKIARKEDAVAGFMEGKKLGLMEVDKYERNRASEVKESSLERILDLGNIRRTVESIKDRGNGRKCILFYVGKLAHEIIDELCKNEFEILGIVEDNPHMQEDEFMNIPIYPRDRFGHGDYDLIILGSSSLSINDYLEKEIKEQALGVPVVRMCDYDRIDDYL